MYIPKHFLATDREEILHFIRTYNFATIVTAKDNVPMATHLPFMVEEKENEIILTSHLAKANPQWKEISSGNALVIFSEPHAYISPKHYVSEMNVPTWNYIAVHLYGKGKVFTEQEEAMEVLERTIDIFEKEYRQQWDKLPADYKMKMLDGLVAFQIVVKEIQAKKKLSQNKKESERQNIISAFEKGNSENEKTIAEFMKKNKPAGL